MLEGQPKAYVIAQWHAFREHKRTAPVMASLAAELSEKDYTAWSLQLMRGGSRPHGTAAQPDPLLAGLSNAEIEALAAHFASLR